MEVKNILFEDGGVTIIYTEDFEVHEWGKQTKLLEVDMVPFFNEAKEFQEDCQSFIDSIIAKMHRDAR